ncbi:MAG: phage tail sheath subtilisin-like domain-containing protein [Nitrosarchaeum sp.]|nr:phage tail sheath subtilisin-like domain-containing protein [Nitrosarchaeum sp.]
MSLNLVSPGVNVREVDLTIGGITASNEQVGAIAGPFSKGPVNVPILIQNENDLLKTFGKPLSTDSQYEYWMSASSYLSYGGILRVLRTDGTTLNNSNAGVSVASTTLQIDSYEDYINEYSTASSWSYASRNPGSWANNLKVCAIDAAADQRVAIGTFGMSVGYGITVGLNTSYAGIGTVGSSVGYLRGIITNVGNQYVDVKVTDRYDNATGTSSLVSYSQNSINSFPSNVGVAYIKTSSGVSTSIEVNRFYGSVGSGSTIILPPSISVTLPSVTIGNLVQTISNGIVNESTIVGLSTTSVNGSTQTTIVTNTASVGVGTNVEFVVKSPAASGINFTTGPSTPTVVSDWYNLQTLGLTNSTVYWKTIAERPSTSQYVNDRSGKNDEIHIVVVDDSGSVTGIAGNIVEKFTYLSKAFDGKISPTQSVYYKDFISANSEYIFAGAAPTGSATGFTSTTGYANSNVGNWAQNAQSTTFSGVGNVTYNLTGGVDYSSSGGMGATLANIITSYNVLSNPAEYQVNFLINGPSGGSSIYESQAKANALIGIAEARKDCIAIISPHKSGIVNITNSDTQTTNIINFFDPITSSSYAVFDSGYKYMFDRFNNTFRYIPCSADVAGLMARTSINQYSWFSPAGASRGAINGAVKLAYNPSKAQRDLLYPKRINPIIFSPGAGIILYGDKTALSYVSAFDRINVRRLFLTIESTIERAARAQLFEFNDIITRSNFVNIVEPYLRDVKSKRGIIDFLVVCDETNNTPDVIDGNQFRADIFVKPARSINFIGLTFVATRTGVSFEEVVGNV